MESIFSSTPKDTIARYHRLPIHGLFDHMSQNQQNYEMIRRNVPFARYRDASFRPQEI